MKMSKLFTTIFDEELKSRGFKRKAKLYYRLNGDILQGVVIKAINPYSIHFYSAPYWMENIQVELFPLYKGYWAENGVSISPWCAYYREENEQFNIDIMNICFTLAKNYVLPFLDQINDLDSYIDNCVPNWTGIGTEFNSCAFEIRPGEVDEKYSYINDFPINMVCHIWDNLYTYSAFLKYACIKGNLQKGYDLLEEKVSLLPSSWCSKDSVQNRYMEFMIDDGLTRAERYLDERRSIMLPRLRDELGLDTFNL